MSKRFKLTADSIKKRCPLVGPDDVDARGRPARQRTHWDTDLAGFGLRVGRRTKSFVVQRDIAGRTVLNTIGRIPPWTADEARRRARELIVDMDKGIDPNARVRQEEVERRREEWRRLTLADAVEEHVANMRTRRRADRSISQLREELDRHLGDWLRRPLVEIRRQDCIGRHRRLTERAGPVVANRVMRCLRACWNSARRRFEELPEHPVGGVTFNPQRRRREPIPWEELPAWWERVQAIDNPIRRDLHVLMLLTGLRRTDACTIRWEYVDESKGTLHRPKPKGGEDRAFTIPLSAHALALLARRRAENRFFGYTDRGWAFPTRDRQGRVVPVQEPKVKGLPSAHRLRDTFATACLEAGIGSLETKVLMNHALPSGDVTMGYQRPSLEHLRTCQEKVTAFLLEKAESEGRRESA